MNQDKIRVVDIFSGAGGLSAGFHQASDRFTVVAAVEKDRDAAATFGLNFTEAEVFQGEVGEWLKTELPDKIDVLVGGPPCQGFSSLGKQDLEDTRNVLWQDYAEVVKNLRPKIFILENVPQFEKSNQYKLFSIMLNSGKLQDYEFESRILNSADFGVPQVRKRLVVIGSLKKNKGIKFPTETHEAQGPRRWNTFGNAVAGVDSKVTQQLLPERTFTAFGAKIRGPYSTSELHVTRSYTPISHERIKHIGANGNRRQIPDDLLPNCWKNNYQGSNDVMGRLSMEKPSVTIRTEFFKPEKGRYLHPFENRAITHFEAARLQGFPDDYLWAGSKSSVARQIGNAVPVGLAKSIGEAVIDMIGSSREVTS